MTEDILDVKTNLVKSETAYVKHAFFEVDLENYSVQVIGTDTCSVDNGYTYQVHQGDEWIYLTRMNSQAEKAEWYAVNPKTEEIVNIINLESQAPYIIGVIDDVIYAERENVVYRCDWLQNETLEEFYTVDDTTVVAEVLDEQIWIATDKSFEVENNYIEYTILDNNGNELQTNYYPEYFTFLDMIDDKVIYYRPFAEQIEWWCEKDNLSTLESSICIGEYCGINEE